MLNKMFCFWLMASISSAVSDSQWPHGPQPSRLLCPRDFPGKGTGVGCHRLLPYLDYSWSITWESPIWGPGRASTKYFTCGEWVWVQSYGQNYWRQQQQHSPFPRLPKSNVESAFLEKQRAGRLRNLHWRNQHPPNLVRKKKTAL